MGLTREDRQHQPVQRDHDLPSSPPPEDAATDAVTAAELQKLIDENKEAFPEDLDLFEDSDSDGGSNDDLPDLASVSDSSDEDDNLYARPLFHSLSSHLSSDVFTHSRTNVQAPRSAKVTRKQPTLRYTPHCLHYPILIDTIGARTP